MTPYPIGSGYWVGAVVVVFLFILFPWPFLRTLRFWRAFEGADGRLSTSKFQFWLWTVIVVFSYCALWFTRWLASTSNAVPAIDDIPKNVLIAMGISTVTAVAAKGVTNGQVDSGQTVKTPANKSTVSQLVADDSGVSDLSKIQLLTWTFIAIGVYIGALTGNISRIASLAGQADVCPKAATAADPANPCELPDIDASLMVLMGLGSTAYLGKKLVSGGAPAITGLTPLQANYGGVPTVTLSGSSFGTAQGGSQLYFVLPSSPAQLLQPLVARSWSDSQVTFDFPQTYADGTGQQRDWPPGNVNVGIGVIVSGQASNSQTLLLRSAVPAVNTLQPDPPVRGQQVTVRGVGFRAAPSLSRLTVIPRGGAEIDIPTQGLNWAEAQIQFTMPAANQLPGGVPAQIAVEIGSQRVLSPEFTPG